jgi:rod shape-determining protein MreC
LSRDHFGVRIWNMTAELLADSKLFLILILISVFLLLLDNTWVLNFPKTAVQTVTSPIQYGLYRSSLGIGKQLNTFFLIRKSVQEKQALEEQLAVVLSENADLRKRLAEREAFATQEAALSPQNFNLLPVHPIGISRYLYIDKGSDDGLKAKEVVIYKDNMIGRIVSVDPKKSAVLLLTDPDSHLAAFSESTEGKAKGALAGQFGSEMLMDKILHEEQIKEGDLVYSEGSEVEIPRGLVLGQVSQVLNKDNGVFKQAQVKPVFDVTSLDLVFVITN